MRLDEQMVAASQLGLATFNVDLSRLADYLAEETVRCHLANEGIVLRPPQYKISSPGPEYVFKKRRLKHNRTS